MVSLVALLVFCQALGATVGAGTAVWGELAYIQAMHDRKIDQAERRHLLIIGHGLRYGMSLMLLASLGLIIVAYVNHNAVQPAVTPSYWTQIVLALIIITIAWGLARKYLSFTFASASIFTAWWFVVYLCFGFLPLTFGSALATFVVAVVVFNALLYYTRLLAVPE